MASWFDVAGFGYQEFSAGGVRTFAIVEGRTGGVPLVLLHDVPGASFVWSTTVQAIGRERRIIAPDLPGWGRSHNRIAPKQTVLTPEALRGWLVEVIQAHQSERSDIGGIGAGAWLALDYLLGHAAQVRRIALLNLRLTDRAPQRWPWQKRVWTRERLQKWFDRETGLTEPARTAAQPQFDELLAGGWHARESPEFPVNLFRDRVTNYAKALRSFDGEVLLGWGRRASGYDERAAAQLAQGRAVVVWSEAADFPMWDQPPQFQAEITDFFQS
ncbi:MAG: alpha/beta hydrolase [bacterium]|nr:alpha/beta hydrolase [bacterium]